MNGDCNRAADGGGRGAISSGRLLQILVVDDDKDVSCAIARTLEHLGHRALCCGHAQEALALLPTQNFDLLLVDYRMPDMTGLDLIAMLRQAHCTTPVIIMTGHFATEDRVPVHELGISAILRKPITLLQLERVLDDLSLAGGIRPI